MQSKIVTLDQKLKELAKIKAPTKATRAEMRELKKELETVYSTTKAKLIEFETKNYQFLAFLHSTGGFYKLIGHSALFYAIQIAPRLNLKVRLRPDDDFLNRSEEGMVSVRDLDKLATQLEVIKIKKVEKKSEPEVVFFKLPWKSTPEKVEELLKENQLKVDELNQIVLPRSTHPVLYASILELTKATYENGRRIKNTVGERIVCAEFVERVIGIEQSYLEMSNGQRSEEETLRQILAQTLWLKNRLKIIADLAVFSVDASLRIARHLERTSELSQMALKKL